RRTSAVRPPLVAGRIAGASRRRRKTDSGRGRQAAPAARADARRRGPPVQERPVREADRVPRAGGPGRALRRELLLAGSDGPRDRGDELPGDAEGAPRGRADGDDGRETGERLDRLRAALQAELLR